MPRFVVLEHDSPRGRHWDFMLEMGSVLATWALTHAPQATFPIPARRLPDHRLAYLEYQGPVSGDRGSVTRWDQGTYEIEGRTESEWVLILSGGKLAGQARLERVPEAPDHWQFWLGCR